MQQAPHNAVAPEPTAAAEEDILLSAASTSRLIHYLRSYAAAHVNQAQAVRRLLGCSIRTAKRMLSTRQPYRARMKLSWATRICISVNKSVEDVMTRRVTKDCRQALIGWASARTFSESLQLASDCAQAVCLLAFHASNLRGWYTLLYSHGWPYRVEVHLSPCPEMSVHGVKFAPHQLIITLDEGSDGQRRMFVRHYHPTLGHLAKLPLTFSRIEKLILQIHALTKNYPTKLEG